MEFTLQPATADDQLFLAELFADVHIPEFAPLGLPAASLDQLMAMQFNAQRSGYSAQFPHARDRIIWAGRTRIGRLLVDERDRGFHLIDIALLASHRGQGIGEKLLSDLCEQARATGMPLKLSVRFGNRAQRLYERMGFVSTGGNGINIDMELRAEESFTAELALPAYREPASGNGEDVPQAYTGKYFRTLIGRTIEAGNGDGVKVPLVLKEVRPLKVSPLSAVDLGDSFALTFRGPAAPMLGGVVAEMSIAGADEMSMLLVPVGADADGVTYEAIFNRMRPLQGN